jgi:hypothetical protein
MRTFLTLATTAAALAHFALPANAQPAYPPAQPTEVQGPPGGGMDPAWGYGGAAAPQVNDPQADPQGYDGSMQPQDPNDGAPQDPYGQYGQPGPDGPLDPQAPGATTADVTDDEIDQSLQPYGEWVDDPDYGQVWRPYATDVGMDFTPYESGGGWVDTDGGWAFDSEYDWGWLPFHYGQWAWMSGGYWGWCRGHHWSPAWVDWRHGGGLVGWRPIAPELHGHHGPVRETQWRFANEASFGRPHIRAHLFGNPAEGLRATTPVQSLGLHGSTRTPINTIMHSRVAASPRFGGHVGPPHAGGIAHAAWAPPAGHGALRSSGPGHSTIERGSPTWQPRSTYGAPAATRGYSYSPHSTPFYGSRPAPQYSSHAWVAPRSSYSAPSHASWSSPSHSSYSAPSHSSYSAPSHSSYGGGGGGGGHSAGGGGGGGHGRR